MLKKLAQSLISTAIFLAIILLVWLGASLAINNEAILPSISSVIVKAFEIVGKSEFASALGATVLHSLIGFAISFVVGFALAVLATRFKWVKRVCMPMVSAIRLLPTMAIALIVYLWTSAVVAPALVAFVVVMPTVYSQSLVALSSVDGELLQMAKVYEIKQSRVISKIYLPIISDALIETIATTLSLTLKVVIASEVLVGSGDSLGQLMFLAQNTYADSVLLFALVFWSIVIGLVAEWTIRLVYFGIKRGIYAKKYDNK